MPHTLHALVVKLTAQESGSLPGSVGELVNGGASLLAHTAVDAAPTRSAYAGGLGSASFCRARLSSITRVWSSWPIQGLTNSAKAADSTPMQLYAPRHASASPRTSRINVSHRS